MDLFDLIFLSFFVLAFAVRMAFVSGKEKASIDSIQENLLFVLVTFAMVFLPILYLSTDYLDFADYGLPEALAFLGLPISLISIYLLYRSHKDLGRFWSKAVEIKKGHRLITTGVYTHIRHPMYSSHVFWAFAQLFLIHNWIAGPAMLLTIIPFYTYRIWKEEALLYKEFGDDYREYAKKTKRLLPFLC